MQGCFEDCLERFFLRKFREFILLSGFQPGYGATHPAKQIEGDQSFDVGLEED